MKEQIIEKLTTNEIKIVIDKLEERNKLKKELYKLKMEYRNLESEMEEADKIILAGIDIISALEKASREKSKPWLKQ